MHCILSIRRFGFVLPATTAVAILVGTAKPDHPATAAAIPVALPAAGTADDHTPGYAPTPAASEVSQHEMVLPDAGRRDVPIRIYIPGKPAQSAADDDQARADGPYPLIVFSHGAGGDRSAFELLGEHLARHGYIVISPTHSDSIRLRREQGERLSRDDLRSVIDKVDLRSRTADVRLILDSFDAIEKDLDRGAIIDRDRLGMAGHSAGAMTTQTLAGVKFFLGGRGQGRSTPEPRFDAFAVISGQGTEKPSFTERSWEGIDRPMLVMTGSEDTSRASGETPESRRHPYEYAPADTTKYLVFIEGATHASFQGPRASRMLREQTPRNADWIVEITNTGVLAFFDAHVRENEDARTWLDAGKLREIPGGELEFEHK